MNFEIGKLYCADTSLEFSCGKEMVCELDYHYKLKHIDEYTFGGNTELYFSNEHKKMAVMYLGRYYVIIGTYKIKKKQHIFQYKKDIVHFDFGISGTGDIKYDAYDELKEANFKNFFKPLA